tara:strand:+ start:4723 stop:5502 length:780 start_codon:yes stop_codon:yes gene_type:complete
MSSKKYKNIYINGCSFTAGHHLLYESSWPYLLGKKLGLNTISRAVNGQSFDSIFVNTINHLSMLNSNDTLVVVGITWSTRYSVAFDEITANVTPVDVVADNPRKKLKENFEDKIHRDRRLSSPYTFDDSEMDKLFYKFYGQGDIGRPTEKKQRFDKLMMSFVEYYESRIKYDNNLQNNQELNLLTKVVALEGFLKSNNFNYRFIDFANETKKQHNIIDLLDKENIITFDDVWKDKYVYGHPTEKGCVNISEVLYDSINR